MADLEKSPAAEDVCIALGSIENESPNLGSIKQEYIIDRSKVELEKRLVSSFLHETVGRILHHLVFTVRQLRLCCPVSRSNCRRFC